MDSTSNQISLQEIVNAVGEKQHELRLSKTVSDSDQDDVFIWTTAIDSSMDQFMQKYYLEQMVKCIRRKGDVTSYLKGLHYTHKTGKKDLNRELANELIEKHPIAGRFYKFINYLPPNVFFNNIFD